MLTNAQANVFITICRGGVWSSRQLEKSTGYGNSQVRRIIRTLRIKFMDNDEKVRKYIYLTANGYSIEEKAEYMLYETNFRLRLGYGVLYNGRHVLTKCKRLTSKGFNNLMIEYKPKVALLAKLTKGRS